jgi:2-oxo-4-hydroxy-4-carboxy--5-ureidoimidazoline (OHCU) decarboxylase
MSVKPPISLGALNAADQQQFIAALGDIYKHSPWVAKAAYAQQRFVPLTAPHERMSDAVTQASESIAASSSCARRVDLP